MDDNDFFSVNRLVDFGMSMALATQMTRTMNTVMGNMNVPGSSVKPMPHIYYVAINNKSIGPLNESELSQLIGQKKINKDTLAWMPGMKDWQPIENVPAILRLVALTPPELPKNTVK